MMMMMGAHFVHNRNRLHTASCDHEFHLLCMQR